jgi:translation initiation factor 2B subunit (eIF-2B alpha/beta/delta family)
MARSVVEEIALDREHGAARLSLRALEGLGARARELVAAGADPARAAAELRGLARALADARPTMAVIRNRVDRLMHGCPGAAPALIAAAAGPAIARAEAADRGAAEQAAARVAGRRVLTLSRSATVTAALIAGRPSHVWIAESRPGGEGVPLAAELAAGGLAVTLIPDAALATVSAEVVIVGADAIRPPAGSVVNKVGTRLAALAARDAGVPFLVAAATDKIGEVPVAELERELADAELSVGGVPMRAPLFEITPSSLVSGVITERGTLDREGIGVVLAELEALARW